MNLLIVCFLAASLLNACVTAPSPAPDTPDLSIPLTNAAQTADARATLNAGQTAVAQLTLLAAIPTLPPAPPTSPPTTPPTETPPPASPTLVPFPCYRAEVIADLSAPPNALLPVGASFVKTWRMRNSGACPWTPQFSLVLSGGDPMGSTTIHPLGNQVAPGESLNLSIGLIAPGFPGVHQGNWFLRSTDGEMFGSGINAETPLQVIINTVQPLALNTNTYDLTFNMCSAIWESGSGVLGCPGNRSDLQGSISLLSQPALESRLASGLALLMRPNLAVDGWINGRFPAYFVRSNDHFMAEIGCLTGSPNCRLTFRLEYRATDGSSGRLGNWRETFDGQTTLIDVDLSNLVGKAIQLIFSVENMGVAENANAFWLQPRILNQTPTSNLVLTWTREGFPGMPCSELRIFLNNAGQGEAWAISCSPYSYELGRTSLSALEVRQLFDWIQRLRSFDAEISRSSPVTPIITWLRFEGTGINDASDPDLQAINSFATRLFDQIAP
ncbi:MAG TPA: NBR1-Ig-like domain-containing protein [Anaerolineales bacterium]|nr:NBR1-Ig-like domain-containing protein [Anaerolineales bacterium]